MPVCASCGTTNPPEAKFCFECASPLAAAAPAREVRKTVTVVFCDVTGSTRLGESTDPEALRALLVRYFERMKAIVEAHGGTVEKFIGDAVMAVFGVPVLHEDDALRAVRAAREMRDALPDLGVQARIGVNTGEVVTGTAERLATGDAVNVAARLEQAAAPGEVLLGSATVALLRGAAEVEPRAPLELKGKSEPVSAFRLVGIAPDTRERQLEGPLVARERERRLLDEAFDIAVSDRVCHLFTLLGVAGVGKSRLAAEFLRDLDATVVRGRCLSYGQGITYWPVVEIVEQLRPEQRDLAPAVARPLRDLLAGEGSASAEEIAFAARKLFEGTAAERPLVLVWEDLHWAEPTLLDLVEHVADWAREAPILLLCLARPELLERRSGWGGGKLHATTVLLEPLARSSCEALLESLAPDLDPALRERITVAAEGNPLFVEEMVAVARAAPAGEVGMPPTISALLAARLDQLPAAERDALERGSVEGAVFHRGSVEALDGDPSQLPPLVRKQLLRPDKAVLPADDAFRFRHILIRDAAYEALPKVTRADLHERFAAWLEQEGPDLVELDEIVGYHLEQAHRVREQLGAAGDDDGSTATRAGEALARAGRRAVDRGDVSAAINLLKRATSLLEQDGRLRRLLQVDLGYAYVDAGSLDAAEATFLEVGRAASTDGDEGLGARAHVGLLRCRASSTAGSGEELLAAVVAEIATLERAGDDVGLAEAWELAATAEAWCGRTAASSEAYDRAEAHAGATDRRRQQRIKGHRVVQEAWGHLDAREGDERCERMLADAAGTSLEPFVLTALALHRCLLGEFAEARSDVRRARALLRDFGDRLMADASSMAEAQVELVAGDSTAAEATARAGWEALAEIAEQGFRSTVGCFLAEAIRRQGREAEAERIATEAAALGPADDFVTQGRSRVTRALVLARRGELREAEQLAREAVAVTAGSDSFFERAEALVGLADVLELAGDAREATACLADALTLLERKGATAPAQRVRQRIAGASSRSGGSTFA